jgi:hypothetical protein
MNWNEIFEYKDGCLYLKEDRSNYFRKGFRSGSAHSSLKPYLRVKYDGKSYYVHRIIWEILNGPIPVGMQIDHINGNKQDNRICNLRLASQAENQWNQSAKKNSKTGIKGVNWHKQRKKWVARISKNKKRYSLGYFDTLEEATNAYYEASLRLHKEFAKPLELNEL